MRFNTYEDMTNGSDLNTKRHIARSLEGEFDSAAEEHIQKKQKSIPCINTDVLTGTSHMIFGLML